MFAFVRKRFDIWIELAEHPSWPRNGTDRNSISQFEATTSISFQSDLFFAMHLAFSRAFSLRKLRPGHLCGAYNIVLRGEFFEEPAFFSSFAVGFSCKTISSFLKAEQAEPDIKPRS